MLPATKPTIAIAAAWLATVTAAFWLGGKGGTTGAAAGSGSPSELASFPASSPASTRDSGDTLADGSRRLSSASGASRTAGSGPDRILRLLSGASGADLGRSDFRDIAEQLSLAEVVEVIDQIASMKPAGAARRLHRGPWSVGTTRRCRRPRACRQHRRPWAAQRRHLHDPAPVGLRQPSRRPRVRCPQP